MTYDEYIAQQQQAIDEEQPDDCCFLEYQPEGQFVRGHWDMDYLPQNPASTKSEEGMKPYSHFYQYTYVAIYRQLQAEQKPHPDPLPRWGEKEYAHSCTSEDISFEPVSVEQPFRLKRHVIQADRNTILEVFFKRAGENWMASLPPPI